MIPKLDYRGKLTDRDALAARLAETGLSQPACSARADLFAAASRCLARTVPSASPPQPIRAFFVPGRVEVLGKHTDYAGGRSMVIAAEQGFSVLSSPRADRRVRIVDPVRRETAEFEINRDLSPRAGHWSNYPMTIARRIARNFAGPLGGADIALASDLPPAAGMSSSSAMIVAMFLALADANRLDQRPDWQANLHSMTDLAGASAFFVTAAGPAAFQRV